MLNRVADVEELRIPPGNRLEKLHGDREGQRSIRASTTSGAFASSGATATPGM
jgi:plasmid maintenance system killer protein